MRCCAHVLQVGLVLAAQASERDSICAVLEGVHRTRSSDSLDMEQHGALFLLELERVGWNTEHVFVEDYPNRVSLGQP